MVAGRLRKRLLGRRAPLSLERHPDDLPKRGLFAEPVRVARLDTLDPESLGDGSHRVTFLVEVRDAEGKRCSQVAVEAMVTGPERSGTPQAATDLLGRVRFRTTGPPGSYAIEVTDVAAGGLDWDAAAGPTRAAIELPSG